MDIYMKDLLKELQQFFESTKNFDKSLFLNIADAIKNNESYGMYQNYFWELKGTPTQAIAKIVADGKTQGDDWELLIDTEPDADINDYDQRAIALLDYLNEIESLNNIKSEEKLGGLYVILPNKAQYLVFDDFNKAEEAAKTLLEKKIALYGIAEFYDLDDFQEFLDDNLFKNGELTLSSFHYFNDVVDNPELFDMQGFLNKIVKRDGPEQQLATYAYEEESTEYNGKKYYIYRLDEETILD